MRVRDQIRAGVEKIRAERAVRENVELQRARTGVAEVMKYLEKFKMTKEPMSYDMLNDLFGGLDKHVLGIDTAEKGGELGALQSPGKQGLA